MKSKKKTKRATGARPHANSWPFDQPPNCAAISLRQILAREEPILHVCHNADDHGWQFLGWGDAKTEDGVVICLAHVLEMDPTICQVADLLPGWHAWRRAVGKRWFREFNPHRDDDI